MTNPFLLQGKRYLVTGAASGIGRATALFLAEMGAELILADINTQGLEDTKNRCLSNCIVWQVNLTNFENLRENLEKVVTNFGKLDGYVHCAGIAYISPLKTISASKTEEIFKLNTQAAIELSKAFTHRNIHTGNGGSIVFISSVYGLTGSAANVAYAMSKSALHGITKSLAIELSPKKIRVNCVAPGFIKTNMMDANSDKFDAEYTNRLNSLHPLGIGEASDIAHAVSYLLSDAAKWVTGSILCVDGGFTAQ